MRIVLLGDESSSSRTHLEPTWGVARLHADWKLRGQLARSTSQLAFNEAVTEVNEIIKETVETENLKRPLKLKCGAIAGRPAVGPAVCHASGPLRISPT